MVRVAVAGELSAGHANDRITVDSGPEDPTGQKV